MRPSSERLLQPPHNDIKNDERREWLRIEDRLLLEYRRCDETAEAMNAYLPPVTEDTIATAVSKPTLDLLVRGGETFAGSPLLPWVSKIDWMLETILKSMVKSHPGSVAIARLTDVDISAGGLGFDTPRRFEVDEVLAIKFILPPFSMIETTARIIRVTPLNTSPAEFHLATQFVDIGGDEQELIIRHILQVQAERLRARKAAH
ncbi:MAG: PilZ domain-containing protein [Nitrospira sp.]|nr:PilZ domain-containing protein [Nitrospira sp.]ULA59019.1 MAG: PilZ domain-containing protein [Nitrospira sp.]